MPLEMRNREKSEVFAEKNIDGFSVNAFLREIEVRQVSDEKDCHKHQAHDTQQKRNTMPFHNMPKSEIDPLFLYHQRLVLNLSPDGTKILANDTDEDQLNRGEEELGNDDGRNAKLEGVPKHQLQDQVGH